MYKSYKGTRSGVPFRHVRIRDNDWSGGHNSKKIISWYCWTNENPNMIPFLKIKTKSYKLMNSHNS